MADLGWDDFYEGETAQHQARALAAAGSPIALEDLRGHTSTWTEPISTDYRGTTVTTHPPNSQGFVALEILNVLARFEPPAPRVFAGGRGADLRWTHLGLEAAKLAMADRDAYLTDPAVSPTPLERLLSPTYAAELARRIDPSRARMGDAGSRCRGAAARSGWASSMARAAP